MKKSIPDDVQIKSLLIGGIPYRITLHNNIRMEDGSKLDGLIRVSEQEIKLSRECSYLMQYQTMWHEILHAIAAQSGRRELGEDLIEALAFGIVSVLAANRDILP